MNNLPNDNVFLTQTEVPTKGECDYHGINNHYYYMN
jgi:hypothetical protein